MGGAARYAYDHFGAEWGNGVGPQGRCYAIPTMHGSLSDIKPYVDDFIEYARQQLVKHPELTVAAISETSGFLSLSYFTKIFTKKTGYTPSRWRKKLIESNEGGN